jgi:hypothetical protein
MGMVLAPYWHAAGAGPSALLDDLVGYWPLGEASGDALDAHGSSDLTDNSTVGSAAGKVGNARDFEAGSSEHLSRADSADLSTGDIDFTVQAWVNFESLGAYRMLVTRDDFGASQREYALYYDLAADRLVFLVSSDGTATATVAANAFGAPSTATWYLVHAWHDAAANQIGIAVNAGAADTASHSAGVRDGTAPFALGAHFNSGSALNTHDGLLDEVGFWKRVLTSGERAELYGGGSGLSYPFS